MKRYINILILTMGLGFQLQAKVYIVDSEKELDEAVAKVIPGDTVLLSSGNWNDVKLEFKGNGTTISPIVFAAETAGKTIFTGNSQIEISGHWLVVRDFVFKDGKVAESGSIIAFRNGTSTPAHNCRLTNVSIDNYNPEDKNIDTKYVSLYGTYNRVDHCSFSGKNNSGATFVVWLDETPDHHLIDHNYFGQREALEKNGGETIRIGTSEWESYNSNCVVEYNLFDECDGEIEIISNKSVGNHYRYNTFYHCEGTLTLRHGSDCWVYGNFFFGDERKDCGGIRIIGPGHRVFNNYLENLEGTSYRAAICLANGVPNSPANRYRQVDDARIGYNTIVNCKEPFAIGAGVDDEKSLAPTNSSIENNLIISREEAELITAYDSADGVTWKGIFTNAKNIGITAEGFIQTALPMILDGKIQGLTSDNPAVGGAVSGTFDTLTVDIDGQTRPATAKDAGCNQLSNSPKAIWPLAKEEVGAHYEDPTFSQIIEEPQHHISLGNGRLHVTFENEEERTLSIFSISGEQLTTSRTYGKIFDQAISEFPRFFILEIREQANKYAIKLIQ